MTTRKARLLQITCTFLLASAWPTLVRADDENAKGPPLAPSEPAIRSVVVTNPSVAAFPPTGWNAQVAAAVLDAEAHPDQKMLDWKGFTEVHPTEGRWIDFWCTARVNDKAHSLTGETEFVCSHQKDQASVSIMELAAAVREQNPATCGGFGLTVPLFGIRLLKGSGTTVNGPVQAGLGGGYYFADRLGKCSATFSTGPEVFGYSEGLDPSGKFHVGIGLGWQLVAFKQFQFGMAAGYDLYRRETATTTDATGVTQSSSSTNGLLALQDLGPRPSLTFLLTFSVTSGSGQGETGSAASASK